MPLTALFRYLRKQKERNPQLKVPMLDTGGVYVALCVISAGVGNPQGRGYYAGAVLLAAWALYALRPRHARLAAWVLLFAARPGLATRGTWAWPSCRPGSAAWSPTGTCGARADPYAQHRPTSARSGA